MIFKTNLYFDLSRLLFDLERYIDIFDERNQLAITYDDQRVPDNVDPHFVAIGRSPADIDQWQLTKVCPIFQNSYFATILNEIPYQFQRVRLMRMAPKTTYSMHRDMYKRLHWALKTFPSCHITFQGTNSFLGWHIPADGYGYMADTTKMHCAINPSDYFRYHLVVDIKEPK